MGYAGDKTSLLQQVASNAPLSAPFRRLKMTALFMTAYYSSFSIIAKIR